MSDVGEVKAKVIIEYDGSGIQQAKEDLASLADAAGSFGGDGGIGDAISAMSNGFAEGTKGAGGFADAVGAIEEPLKLGETAVSQLNDTLGEHQQAIENTGSAYEALQEPLGATVAQIEAASSPTATLAERAQSLATQIQPVNDNFAQLGDTLSQSVPLLPQFADSLHEVSQAFDPKQFGLDTFAENMSVFQDALQNPYPFSMIQSHLNETGQTWSDFTSSIGGENTAALHGMAQNANVAGESLNKLNTSAEATGQAFTESRGETQAFTEQFNAMGGAAQDASKSVAGANDTINSSSKSMGETLTSVWGTKGSDLQKAMAQMGGEEGSIGGVFRTAFGEIGGVLESASQFVMPLMALQMVGMAVQQVGQGIYDAAAIAEGPGAHGIGTFTGTVDALSQTMAKSGQSFSESFGQQLLPTLNAINYQMNQGAGGGIGGFLGGLGSDIANNLMMVGGLVSMTVPGGQGIGWDMFKAGGEGMINQAASAIGLPQPFQGPGPVAQAQINYQQQMAQLPQTVQAQTLQSQGQTATIMQEALDPQYLQAQEHLSVAQQFLQKQQASFNASHPDSPQQELMTYRQNQYDQQQAQIMQNQPTYGQDMGAEIQRGDWGGLGQSLHDAIWGPSYSGSGPMTTYAQSRGWPSLGDIGQAFQNSAVGQDFSQMFGGAGQTLGGIGNFFSGLFGGGQQQATPYGPVGCFIAGTRVLLANGTEKPIETLQVGEKVLAHNGMDEVVTTVLARIVPPPRQVYELTFSNGNTLTTTDSHPIATPLQGWKALSVEHAKLENPDLSISTLQVGDSVSTVYGTCTLVSIQPKEIVQVYNITVGEPHTFYANHVLVHNKGESMTAAGTGTESVSLAHTFRADVTWEANNLNKQFTAVANWAEQGLMHAVTAVANWTEQNVRHAITAVANWTEQNVIHPVVAAAEWTEQNVQHAVQAVANWTEQNVIHPVVAAAEWTAQNLEKSFTAVASWAEKNLEHTFLGIASWVGQNLTHTFVGIAQWIQQTVSTIIPGFAGGVENFGGGAAFIAENGPELVMLPSGSSVYPMSTGGGMGNNLSPISLGGGSGGSAPQTANISVHLDSQMLTQILGVSLMQNINVSLGKRSF